MLKISVINTGLTLNHLHVEVSAINRELDDGEFLVAEEIFEEVSTEETDDADDINKTLGEVEEILSNTSVNYTTADLLESLFSTIFFLGIKIGNGQIEIPYKWTPGDDYLDD
jgi:hypothetical protein